MTRKCIFLIIGLMAARLLQAQPELYVYPTHWWTGMKHHDLRLLIRNPSRNIGAPAMRGSSNTPFIRVGKVSTLENAHYVQIDISILPQARPGSYRIFFGETSNPSRHTVSFDLRPREGGSGVTRVQGVTSRDLTYLLMPDRFANGDTNNDAYPELRDPVADRSNKFARHGGDLQGVMNHLDYFNELGVTTLWFTPVTENDMPRMQEGVAQMAGYHGYWFTDHYQVDRRFGGNTVYKTFVQEAHKKGLKVIQDAIYNHVGLFHWIHLDPPSRDWVNQWPQFTPPHHREEALMDPYASQHDKTNMVKGWFVRHLPDLNLAHPDLATYLIQHALWSVEEFGFDGFRIDTYKYCDETFLNRMNAALLREFPTLTTFVEAWANTVVANAYYVRNQFNIPFKHNAPGAIDFSLCFSLHAGMTQPYGWTEGVNRIYMTLAQDFVYANPLNNCLFLDNHDMDRVYSIVGENWNKLKWGLNWLLTLRGIPQLYYGTEILMKNYKNPTDAEVRYDFPGGWPGDSVNKFTPAGRTAAENEAFRHISELAQFRKSSSALTIGKTMQFVIREGVYVYFRYDDRQTVMVVTNTGSSTFVPDWSVYAERTGKFSRGRDVISGSVFPLKGLSVPPGESWVIELMP